MVSYNYVSLFFACFELNWSSIANLCRRHLINAVSLHFYWMVRKVMPFIHHATASDMFARHAGLVISNCIFSPLNSLTGTAVWPKYTTEETCIQCWIWWISNHVVVNPGWWEVSWTDNVLTCRQGNDHE